MEWKNTCISSAERAKHIICDQYDKLWNVETGGILARQVES